MYIACKFRNDDIYTMNQKEKNIYFKLDLMKLKTEMEVLTTRREHFRNKLDDIDKEMTDFINNKTTSELVVENIKEKWVKDLVTSNTRIEEVWQKNINGKKEAFQKDKIKMRNLTEESTTPEDIAQTERNANIRKNEDRFYTRNRKPSQNPRYNRSNYSTRYNRYKNDETNSRYRNDTYLENNKKNSYHQYKKFQRRPYHPR